jgi:hypothetical protein
MNNSIIILALSVSLSLVSFKSSVYTNTLYKSAIPHPFGGSELADKVKFMNLMQTSRANKAINMDDLV